MFCYQCQETAKGTGCTVRGVCGKTSDVANLQDLLLFILKGIAHYRVQLRALDAIDHSADRFILDGLFMTITNANFDKQRFVEKIKEAIKLREQLKQTFLDKAGIPQRSHSKVPFGRLTRWKKWNRKPDTWEFSPPKTRTSAL